MELQKRSRSWYSEQYCSFAILANGPVVFAEAWECRFKATQIIAYSFTSPAHVPGFCMRATDTCMSDGWKVYVAWYQEKQTDSDTCFDI